MPHDQAPTLSRSVVGSVVQAISVLRHLGAVDRPQGVTAISRALGISTSSCFNILKTLVAEDLATFDPTSKAYGLGLGTVDLARLALGRDQVVEAAREAMSLFADRHDAAVGLWKPSRGDRLTLVALAESEAATRIHLTVGQRQPVAAGATGRAFLAARNASDGEIEAALRAVRWQQQPELSTYIEEVRKARQKGWATDKDQIVRGVTNVAAPILSADGSVRFCVSASIFSGRETAQGVERIGHGLRRMAHGIGNGTGGAADIQESDPR